MPTETGIWTTREAIDNHDFSYRLAKWIGDFLDKKDVLIDWGCGIGSYLRYFHDRGFENLHGVEGTASIRDFAEFSNIMEQDLTKPITKYPIGNSLCLEVGEHIPIEYTDQFLNNICYNTAHSKVLILSWAVPGQDGIGHVNCQENTWVIEQVCKRNMKFLMEPTTYARSVIEGHYEYFKNTLLCFQKN